MEYKLYRGFILGYGEPKPGYSAYATDVFRSKADVIVGNPGHTSDNMYEAQVWIDKEDESVRRSPESYASQTDVDELNQKLQVSIPYPEYIMQKVRQHIGLEDYDTSRDADIARMTHSDVLQHCLEWEGIIGYAYQIKDWVERIFGVTLI